MSHPFRRRPQHCAPVTGRERTLVDVENRGFGRKYNMLQKGYKVAKHLQGDLTNGVDRFSGTATFRKMTHNESNFSAGEGT